MYSLGKLEAFYNVLKKVANKSFFVVVNNRIESEAFFFFILSLLGKNSFWLKGQEVK